MACSIDIVAREWACIVPQSFLGDSVVWLGQLVNDVNIKF